MNDQTNQPHGQTDPQKPSTLDAEPSISTPVEATAHHGGTKEGEGIRVDVAELPVHGVGAEMELPKEVQEAGVKLHPETIELPEQVRQVGVQPVKHNVPVPDKIHAEVPLSNEQIAVGLTKGLNASFRWFAEQCKRLLMKKKMHPADHAPAE